MRDTIELAREAGFPMAWISDNDGGVIRWKDIKAFEALIRADERALAAPVQEPVAEIISDALGCLTTQWNEEWTPNEGDKLYTTPPAAQRPWVGLTDEERTEIRREHYARTLPLMEAIEAKLKEKNNG